jgi:cytoskeletal protein RodZ
VTRSIGAYLRQAREGRGIELAELEAITRIPRRSLERLEAGEFDARPDGFARGFVRTVAASLGLDPDDAVARMLEEPAPEAQAPRLPRSRLLYVLAVTLAAVALGAALVWFAGRLALGEDSGDEATRVYRRDAVRDLARDLEPAPEPKAP